MIRVVEDVVFWVSTTELKIKKSKNYEFSALVFLLGPWISLTDKEDKPIDSLYTSRTRNGLQEARLVSISTVQIKNFLFWIEELLMGLLIDSK